MKTFIGTLAGVGVVLSVTLALANPALLPKHPGYPASGYANDAGQTNMGGEKASLEGAKADSRHTAQDLKPDTGRDAVINTDGAGRVPRHPGYYDYKIEPPVNSATKIGADRVIQ